MTRRRVAGGVAIAIAYVALAIWSAWLSPIARRPALDGLAPIAPYRWVSPPPELAATNQPPAAGSFRIRFSGRGSEPGVFLTTDNQVTVVVDRGAFPRRRGDDSVELTVTPRDPASLGALPGELVAFGNALELRATYRPSGTTVTRLAELIEVVAVYPVTQRLHASTHTLIHAEDGPRDGPREGMTWTRLPSQDSPGIQQVQAAVPGPGFVVVAGELTPNPLLPAPQDGGLSVPALVLLGLSGATFLAGLVLLLRGRR